MEEKIKVIYEDEEMMVIDKPAGLVVTDEGRKNNETLEDWLSAKQNKLERHGIVHRLDKGTSGLLLVAKTKEALINLKKQFKNREVKKKYLAMVCGDLPFEGDVNAPIIRSKFGFTKFMVSPEGKKSLTLFKLVGKYEYNGKKYSLLDIDLKTGRTHQIRVHLSYLGWPLVGDRLYGGENIEGLDRPFLHAYKISFKHPKTGKEMTFESKMPPDLKELIKKYLVLSI